MKRILFRLSVLGAITGLGLLAIAHAQRPVVPQQDDVPPNPLRQDAAPPVDNPPPSYRTQEVGPDDTAPAPDDNPLRRGRSRYDNGSQPPNRDPRAGVPDTGPSRIRLVAGEEPLGARDPGSRMQVPSGEPRLMPVADDRYAVPSRAGNGRGVVQSFSPEPTPMQAGRTSEPISQQPDGLNGREPDSRQCGTGQPGDKQLEGPQNAQIVLQKMAPPEIQVGRPAVLRTIVRNSGTAPAAEVEVHDQVPRGTRLLGTSPQAAQGRNGELVWSLGTLKPGSETTVEMQIMPTDEGEVGSVASVRFQAIATARSVVTRPKLAVETTGPQRVLAGEDALLTFTVSNPGSGVATGVKLVEHVPAALKYPAQQVPADRELDYNVGDLKPGESRQLKLPLKAIQAGTINNVITVKADANLQAEHRFSFDVLSAKLDVAMNGPKHRYLEREATYQLCLANRGTAPAKEIELVAYLPPGLKFVSANKTGRYDAAARAVFWQRDEMQVNEHDTVELVTMPVAAGQFNLKVRGVAQRGVIDEKEQPVIVEGLASVLFQLSHTKDPLEIGGETTYEISVVNQGSKASTNLQMAVLLPPELKPLAAEGPTRYTIQDNKVLFESLPQLAPKSVAAFRVRAQGIRAGDLRVRCQLMTDEMQRPVVKEESTRVYADE
jgi:uncharacterized repeat protein (TIGR01451 family)